MAGTKLVIRDPLLSAPLLFLSPTALSLSFSCPPFLSLSGDGPQTGQLPASRAVTLLQKVSFSVCQNFSSLRQFCRGWSCACARSEGGTARVISERRRALLPPVSARLAPRLLLSARRAHRKATSARQGSARAPKLQTRMESWCLWCPLPVRF